MVATLPAALGAALVACVLEESPHSLASRGHAKEAAQVILLNDDFGGALCDKKTRYQ